MITNAEEVAGYICIYTDNRVVDKTINSYEVTEE